MGVNPTPTNYKAFTFDGKSSREFGVYITGTGVFNSPERDVEMISIPARNGAYALDKGRFNNIEVTYDCGIVADTDADFAKAISDFRNWLASRQGYCRLVDEYNPNEYRMGLFREVVEVDHEGLRTGEFEITFDCKPQRWLTSGETAVTVADGGTIDNPTLFDASPLLEVKGYGNIQFNGFDIDIENAVLGEVYLADDITTAAYPTYTLDTNKFNVGDTITLNWKRNQTFGVRPYETNITLKSVTDSNAGFVTTPGSSMSGTQSANTIYGTAETTATVTFTAGTSSTITNTCVITYGNSDSSKSVTYTITQRIIYDANDNDISEVVGATYAYSGGMNNAGLSKRESTTVIIVDSTVSALGNPTYIDCDIGECYMIQGGSIVQLNSVIDLGSDLPILSSGTNTFAYDNTVTELKVVPRWWRV